MHPLMAIGLVFLTGLAWMVTVVTLLVALAKARRRLPADDRRPSQSAFEAVEIRHNGTAAINEDQSSGRGGRTPPL